MLKKYLPFKQLLPVGMLTFFFCSCTSNSNDSKKSLDSKNSFDSCSIAKPFETVKAVELMVGPGYTGALKNYWGDDTTKLDFQHFFEKGKLIRSIFYYENGNAEEEYSYKCGSLNGIQKFFYPSGQLAKMIPYRYGYIQGVGEMYDENGMLRQQVTFIADSIIGKPKSFDEKGNLITEENK